MNAKPQCETSFSLIMQNAQMMHGEMHECEEFFESCNESTR